jgi:hypothetical protein
MKVLAERTPDTHAALMRVSLQTGLSLNRLNSPEGFSAEEYARVEESVRRILGVDSIKL